MKNFSLSSHAIARLRPGKNMVALLFAFLVYKLSVAQFSISVMDNPHELTFEATVAGTVNPKLTGSYPILDYGFYNAVPPTGAGTLNSNAWAQDGASEGSLGFGGVDVYPGGSRWVGVNSSGYSVTQGGLYGYQTHPNVSFNQAIGFQPDDGDFTPGWLALKMENNTGQQINSIDISYDVFVVNDQNRASSLNLEYSYDHVTYTSIPALQYTTPATATVTVPLGQAVSTVGSTYVMSTTLPVTWPAGSNLYIRWYTDDVGTGTGARDEFAFDNVSITPHATVGPSNTIAVDSVNNLNYCINDTIGDSLMVFFTSTDTFSTGNYYYLELSDSLGSFSNPMVLDSILSTSNADTFSCAFPANISASNVYKVRVVSSAPAVNSPEYTSAISVSWIPELTYTTDSPTCYGYTDGSIDITPSTASVPTTSPTVNYTYAWSNSATSQDLNNIAAGGYTVVVTGAGGCSITSDSIMVQPADSIAPLVSITDVKCNGMANGTIDLAVSGGTSPYTYLWSNGSDSIVIEGLSAGPYTCLITDASNCTKTVVYTVNEPAELSIDSMITTDVNCYGAADGNVSVTVSGGTMPYSYLWSDNSTGQNLSNADVGTYSVTVTDSNGCESFSNQVDIVQPDEIIITIDSLNHIKCSTCDGEVYVSVTGGTTPYTLTWPDNSNGYYFSTPDTGTYTLEVVDSNGCSQNLVFQISLNTSIVKYNQLSDKMKVYPNPANESFYLELKDTETDESTSIMVMDIVGNIVYQTYTGVGSSSGSKYQVSSGEWAPGMYIVSVINEHSQVLGQMRLTVVR